MNTLAHQIERNIHFIRGYKIMLDRDLAILYGVSTSNLNLAVKRNRSRFPEDFAFRLTSADVDSLILQSAISKGRGGNRKLPFVFTEHGVTMLSSVLRSDRAIQVNIAIMRAFGKLRELLITHRDLAQKLEELEKKYDIQFKSVFDAIRQLMKQPDRRPVTKVKGFIPK